MTFLSPAWTLSGYDVAAHVAEETHDAARNVPRAIIWSSWCSVFLGSVYLISLALCTTDIDSLTGDALGQPIGVLIGQVLGVTGGVVLLAITVFCQMAAGVAFVSWVFDLSPFVSRPDRASSLAVGLRLAHLLRLQPRQGSPGARLA